MNARRIRFNRIAVLVVLGMVLAGCAVPTPQVVEKTVKETVVVEKSVEKTVQQTVVVEKAVEKLVPQTVVVEKQVVQSPMRTLKGKINVSTEGVLPVPGAPLTKRQQAWQKILGQYKKLQPDVEITIEDLPQGQDAKAWCEARKSAKTMPDISMTGNCDYFRPTPTEVKAGTVIATDFMKFSDEINPYTGRPWKDDWLNDGVRLTRCQEGGATDMWTCQPNWLELKLLFVNWDILKEFGVTTMPKTITELWQLSDKINKSGKYQAWDGKVYRWYNYMADVANLTGMDVYKAQGGDPNGKLDVTLAAPTALDKQATLYCNGTWSVAKWPSMQEVFKQAELMADAWGGIDTLLDPTRQPGQNWLTGRAAFWWDSSESMPDVNQAIADGTFKVENWTTEWLPDLTKDDLVNKDLPIAFDGKFWVEYGGQGDVFAPTANVRESGADANVDLITRDFLQFLSSPLGAQRIVDEGMLPVNPIAFQAAPQAWVDALERFTPVTIENYQGITQPLNGWVVGTYRNDPGKNLEAWMRGLADFDTATKKADEAVTKDTVKKLQDNLTQLGMTAVPDVCKPFATP